MSKHKMLRAQHLRLLAAVSIVILAFGLSSWYSERQLGGAVEFEAHSDFSHVRVRRNGNIRSLNFVRDDGTEVTETRLDLAAPFKLLSPYTRAMFSSFLYTPNQRRILIVGLGGGAMVHFLAHYAPDVQATVVEIDPAVIHVAEKYFGIESGQNVHIVLADGVAFVESAFEQYDVVYMDAFLKPAPDTDGAGVPVALKTRAFLELLKRRTAPSGFVVFNLNPHERLDEDTGLIAQVFGRAAIYRSPPAGNRIVVAPSSGDFESDAVLLQRAAELDRRFGGAIEFTELLNTRETRH